MNKKWLYADLSLVLVALAWGSTFVVIKDTLSHAKPLGFMALRFILATVILGAIFNKKLRQSNKSEIKAGAIIGVMLYLALLIQTIGLIYTTASKQAFLTAVYVVIVPFLVWILHKKRPDSYSIIGAVLALVGIGFLTIDGSFSIGALNKGDILTLCCAIFFAGHIVSIGYFAKDMEPIVLSIVQFGVTAILFLVSALVLEGSEYILQPNTLKPALYLAIVGTVFAYTVQNVAQKYTSSTHTAIILSLESVFGTILGVYILGEIMTREMVLGCIVIFVGIIITETKLEFIKSKGEKDSH
ncbi:DMT family transporter [Anaeromicrobium sediminis]|uniref:EamA family transporter n=1 Tax=Anaeromicrobium sediminis TaxID=1478221 RepID=A0A267MHM2_9FIRM|nr:DMT family transporter [Anaeromicrobium sediminis]PAB59026.1 EamA family transporter [Anaeromicrobium sediminis]